MMKILMLKGFKDEDPKTFLRIYKRACLSTGNRITKNWAKFYQSFLEEELVNGMRDNRRLAKYLGNT